MTTENLMEIPEGMWYTVRKTNGGIGITIGEKIKVVLEYRHMTVQELSLVMGYNSPSALYNRFKRDNFSESDLKEICRILNCSYDVVITMNDTGKEI